MNSNDYLFYPGKTPLHPRGKLKHFTKRNNKKSDVEFIKQVPQNPLSSFRIKIKALLRFSLVRDPNQMEKEGLSGIIKNSSKKVSRDCLDEM